MPFSREKPTRRTRGIKKPPIKRNGTRSERGNKRKINAKAGNPIGETYSSYWTYDSNHPYNMYGQESWCNLSMALLISGIIVFGAILVVAVLVDDGHHSGGHHDDEDEMDSRSAMTRYTRMITSLQQDIDEREASIQCPIGSHAWHPLGTLDEPTCRVNYPWPHAVDKQLIRPERFDEHLKNKHDPCESFEAYVCHGWHLSDPLEGRVGSLAGVPASRGFSELGYRNMNLKVHTSMSDTGFLDTTWVRDKRTDVRDKRTDVRDERADIRDERIEPQRDNRVFYHEFISGCANSLSGKFADLGAFSQRVTDLTTIRDQDLEEGDVTSRMGFMFGRAQCHGVSPIVYASPGLDIHNKEREVIYVEPTGILGIRSVLLKSNEHMKKHVTMITLACRVLVDQKLHKNINTCTKDMLTVEDQLVWNSLPETHRKDHYLFQALDGNPTVDDAGLPVIPATRHGFFQSGWWKAYEYGLVAGGCLSQESLEYVQSCPVWTNSLEYAENLDASLGHPKRGKNVGIEETQWKTFLSVALTMDYLEHTSADRLETYLTKKSRRKQGSDARLSFGKPDGPHSVSKPWTQQEGHVRGHYTLSTRGHFGPSTKHQTEALGEMINAYAYAIVYGKRRGAHANKQQTQWELDHYVTVDNSPNVESHLAFWSTCTRVADVYLPGIQDDSFAAVVTSQQERDRIYGLTHSIIDALAESIQESSLLSPEAKGNLTLKARAISVRVAVPWHGHSQPTYGDVGIQGDSFYFDSTQIRSWNMRRNFDKTFAPNAVRARKSVDPKEREGNSIQYHFGMSTSQVNAYYSPEENSINILAGILGAPFYDPRYSNASLYATIGAVIGHELAHGFDSQGVKFDAKGSYRSWLSPQDEKAYDKREQCFVDRYTQKTRLDNVNNGEKTITENIADTMGLRASLRAFLAQGKPNDMKQAMKEFVEAYGQAWCANQTPQGEKLQIASDVHSPANVRVNGAISSLRTPDGRSPLGIAYSCLADSKMVREEPCTLW